MHRASMSLTSPDSPANVVHSNFHGGKQCKFSTAARFKIPDLDANPLHVIHDTSPGPHGHDYSYQRSQMNGFNNTVIKQKQMRYKKVKVRDL